MKTSLREILSATLLSIAITFSGCVASQPKNTQPNALTKQEIKDGWKLLFDGKTTNGWRGANKEKFPEKGWAIEDGALTVLPEGHGGNIVTTGTFGNDFELAFDFKAPLNANSGVKYFVLEDTYAKGDALGLEYQTHDTGKRPFDDSDKHTLGCLYELLQATNRKVNPIGDWNYVRVVSKGKQVQHWLNGIKVLEYERGGKEFKEAVAKSKFKIYPNFGEAPKGHILIQDHNDRTAFRNFKIREL